MSLVEWLAALFGVACVALLVLRSLWNYPFAIASVVLLGWVFVEARLYSDALLQLFYVAINLYGWWNWARVRTAQGEVAVELLSPFARAGWLVGCVGATIAWGWLMHTHTDASRPWWDAAVAIPSVAAQILLARRKLENWLLWIAVDVIAVPLYAAKGLWAAAGLYLLYLALSVWGLLDWRRGLRAAGPIPA